MSAKNLDQKGRHRNKIVAFRVSPEEDALIERAVHLSGLTKQDFIIKRLQNKDIVVQGNPKVFKALKEELKGVMQELQRIDSGVGVDSDLLDTIRLIAITLEGMKKDDEWKQQKKNPLLVTRDFPEKPKPFHTYSQEKYNKAFGQNQ